jgi:hypothetical protein
MPTTCCSSLAATEARRTTCFCPAFAIVVSKFREDRCLRAEEELEQLLGAKRVTPAAAKKALPRTKWVTEYLSERAKANAAAAG